MPRGGVVVGAVVARELGLPLDIVVARKVGHPTDPEYAVGAVDASGTTLLNESETSRLNPAWLKGAVAKEQAEAARREALYRGGRAAEPIAGKTAIIVDDGIATGLTMRLAVRAVRAQKPAQMLIAVPVAPSGAERQLKAEGADELAALEGPEDFLGAVGAHYRHFPQVEDAEVIRLLKPPR